MSSPNLVRQVESFLARFRAELGPTVDEDLRIVAAVSGGPDSLVLLHLLVKQALWPASSVVVAHLDHGLRPTSAAEDERVATLAQEWGVVCHTSKMDVAAMALQRGLSLEEAGRLARYAFLADVAHKESARIVATGHHADDQVETVLLNFLRGSGTAGLQGMRPLAPLPGAADLTLIRPLLDVRRDDIEGYCREHELDPILDESNDDPGFLRNRVRHDLLAELETYNPGVRERLRQLAVIAQGEHELLHSLTVAAWERCVMTEMPDRLVVELDCWRRLPVAMRRETVRYGLALLRQTTRDVGYLALELALKVAETGPVGAVAHLPDEVVLEVGYQTFSLSQGAGGRIDPSLPQLMTESVVSVPVPGRVVLAEGWYLETELLGRVDPADLGANEDPWTACLDLDRVGALLLRPRSTGERFQPLGMGGRSASVKEVMVNRKIPRHQRARWPILANAEHVLWLVGDRVDWRGRVTAQTKQVLRVRLLRRDNDGGWRETAGSG